MSKRVVSLLTMATVLLATACSSSSSPAKTGTSEPATSQTSAAAGDSNAAGVIGALPADLSRLYTNYGGTVSTTTPYASFAAVKTPWKWCHSESFQGNPWRVAVTNEMKLLASNFQKAGKVSSFQVTDSNGNVTQQIAQIQGFIDQKCSVITMIAGSSTGLNGVIEKAYKAGIPVITMAGGLSSPYALNVDSNYYRWGFDMASAIAKRNPSAKILAIQGIAGNPIVKAETDGLNDALKANPGLKIVTTVNGNWAPDTTKQVVLQALATNPGKIDAVWSTGSESRIIAEAFKQAGRPTPLVTSSISGDALGYWKANPSDYNFTGNAVLPVPTAETGFRVAVRVLEGQKPKLSTLLIPLPVVEQNDLQSWYASCMTASSSSIFPIGPNDPVSEDDMNTYFSSGAATAPYDYSQTPSPCA